MIFSSTRTGIAESEWYVDDLDVEDLESEYRVPGCTAVFALHLCSCHHIHMKFVTLVEGILSGDSSRATWQFECSSI